MEPNNCLTFLRPLCLGLKFARGVIRILYRLLTERVLAYTLLLNINALSFNLALSLIDRSLQRFT